MPKHRACYVVAIRRKDYVELVGKAGTSYGGTVGLDWNDDPYEFLERIRDGLEKDERAQLVVVNSP